MFHHTPIGKHLRCRICHQTTPTTQMNCQKCTSLKHFSQKRAIAEGFLMTLKTLEKEKIFQNQLVFLKLNIEELAH